jgi:hypothetical protein
LNEAKGIERMEQEKLKQKYANLSSQWKNEATAIADLVAKLKA